MVNIPLYIPNIINICADNYEHGEMSGRIYHCYDREPARFSNIIQMVELIESFFDSISFPQAATQTRTFEKQKMQRQLRPEKIVDNTDVIAMRGDVASFLLAVKYRQNTSWQGEIAWVEGEETQKFMSVLELLKILSNVLEK